MSENTLPAHLYFEGLIRQWNISGHGATIMHRGDKHHNHALLWLEYADRTNELLVYERDFNMEFHWRSLLERDMRPNFDVIDRIEKQKKFDSDLWVLSVDIVGSSALTIPKSEI